MKRSASAVWNGSLKTGTGSLTTPGGALKSAPYSFTSRFESGAGTNPEELIAAAHSGCFILTHLATGGIALPRVQQSISVASLDTRVSSRFGLRSQPATIFR